MTTELSNRKSLLRTWARIVLSAGFLYGILTSYAPAQAAAPPPLPEAPTVSYAYLADLVTGSQTVARLKVKYVKVVPAERVPGLAADRARFFVEAETQALIRGETVVARKVSFLIDGPAARARKPGLAGRIFLAFARTTGQINQLQLVNSGALVEWSAANEALARKVIADATAAGATPALIGITSAFHSSGAVLGEGETQIFLQTANGTPISLSIVRRPDEQPQFSASLGEIVDDAASLPPAGTMLWYRLACGLPEKLPVRALQGVSAADSAAARNDYAAFRQALAPCERTSKPVF